MLSPQYYYPIFLYTVIVLTIFQCIKVSGLPYSKIKSDARNLPFAAILCFGFAIFLGFRPHSSFYFGDTVTYVNNYNYIRFAGSNATSSLAQIEWAWFGLMKLCSGFLDASEYLAVVSILYFGCTLWGAKRLMPNNPYIAMLFVMGAFSFFTYGTNGIRNGLACSLVILFLSYLQGPLRDKIIAAGIAYFAIAIHKTTMLPIGMALVSVFLIKNFKVAYIFWILSIIISLVAGGAITNIFASLGFDERLSYLTENVDENKFSSTGFRWDFLIYSMMPILLGYYVNVKRRIVDKTYMFLLNTYVLSNAFWVMVIRANYSNRFAYLSWFLYPIVLAYPLLKLDIWGQSQGQKLSLIMFAQIAFTWFMFTIY